MSSFEKSVKGATKIKNAPPKTKYIEHILVATHSGEAGIAEVIRALQYRLRDSTWTVVFKSLITVHLMIREGSPDVTLAYLSKNRNSLAISNFTDAVTQGRNIRHYANYLAERSRSYRDTKTDWVRAAESRLEQISVDKGLLRQTESVQRQLTALLKCDVLDNEIENEITITVFRLLVLDLLALFQVLNQGLINILGHFFEMSKSDAERAMEIYRTFTKQTDAVVQYLSVARQHEHHTRVQVPRLKHAPVHLGRQLEEYLKDDDFEVNRRQYIAEQESKGKGSSKKRDFSPPASHGGSKPSKSTGSKSETKPQANKGPDPDLIDFFDSIEDNQTTMQVSPEQNTPLQPLATGFQPQPMGFQGNGFINPYQQQQQQPMAQPEIVLQQAPQLQPMFTGAGFGGYTPQPSAPQQTFQSPLGTIPQSQEMNSFQNNNIGLQPTQAAPPPPQQLQPMQTGSTNPFRQSMLMSPQQTGSLMPSSPVSSNTPGNRLSTNPFAKQAVSPSAANTNLAAAFMAPTPTGTNPFVSQASPPTQQQQQQGLAPQPTGTTNPFRQSAFVNHTTGLGWQHTQQPIGGGIDALPTQQVFPRPLQQTPWQQQQQQQQQQQ